MKTYISKHAEDYKKFANKLILTSVFTIILSGAIQTLVQTAITEYAPKIAGWLIMLGEVVFASIGLYLVSKNGKKR